MKACSVCGPTDNYYAKGFCGKHYTRNRLARKPESLRRYRQARRDRALAKRYGVSLEWYYQQLRVQDNKCAICGSSDPKASRELFSVDHCHNTGAVRQLLCGECNLGLGKFLDNPELLEKAAAYLRKHNGGN